MRRLGAHGRGSARHVGLDSRFNNFDGHLLTGRFVSALVHLSVATLPERGIRHDEIANPLSAVHHVRLAQVDCRGEGVGEPRGGGGLASGHERGGGARLRLEPWR